MLKGTKKFTLIVREDENIGEMGWVVEELMEMDEQPSVALEGYLIAHDLIEHVNGIEEIGGIGEELQAMGGCWRTRADWGDIRRDNPQRVSSEEILGRDFSNMLERFLVGEEMGQETPELVESGYEDNFNEIWRFTLENIKWMDEDDYTEEQLEEFRFAAERFFHLGIVKHEKLYPDPHMANALFYGIVDALKNKMKAPEYDSRIELTIDYDNWDVEAETLEPEYELY